MKIDLHIHSKDCSDGRMRLPEIFAEAHRRGITYLSITDHDSIECQETAAALAGDYGMTYLTGVELNISFSHPRYRNGKPVSLDVLGYGYDPNDRALRDRLGELRAYRTTRARLILERINEEFAARGMAPFTDEDLAAIEQTVDGAFGRPHIADYMIGKGIVSTKQDAFDTYLVKCNVPKLPVTLEEAAGLIRGAGGTLVLAHPNNPRGTSLASLSTSLQEQFRIIRDGMMPFVDGIECWHSSHSPGTVSGYLRFARREGLMVTGGSDCHQQPVILGDVRVPPYVASQFDQ